MSDQVLFPASPPIQRGSAGILARAYFRMKPFIPGRIRWAIRRSRACAILGRSHATWPVNERAARKPAGWRGWPYGKKFAVVLTHDVESQAGVDRARDLAAMEMRHGFVASFNFIPEGNYADPSQLRRWLNDRDFEVGVHDLNHDGHLYSSRKGFEAKARRINAYLEHWDAVGFRSGFMLRQLEWLHDLNVLYDASTFDTDPFEPQPEGSGTIFPFLVEQPFGHKRYVELPYTLPQDSTLFLLLQQQTPEIWMRKLDWIAHHGGLALVNIHPDYMRFGNGDDSPFIYPAGLVEEFLGYVREKYEGEFWNPLPRALAGWYLEQAGSPE
jgi:hypothetical protein